MINKQPTNLTQVSSHHNVAVLSNFNRHIDHTKHEVYISYKMSQTDHDDRKQTAAENTVT